MHTTASSDPNISDESAHLSYGNQQKFNIEAENCRFEIRYEQKFPIRRSLVKVAVTKTTRKTSKQSIWTALFKG